MWEYNELTKKLLAEGYTAENYPDYVQLDPRYDSDNLLDNFYGGFTYKRWWIFERTFKTPCGLQCKGTSCMTGLSCRGIDWTYENDMATIYCPYRKSDCEKRHNLLPKDGVLKTWCNVHMIDEEYRYEGSVESILKLEDHRIAKEKIDFIKKKHGRVCDMHMRYDYGMQCWEMNYSPAECARLRCVGQHCGEKYNEGLVICPVLGHPLDKARGNVYYDIKITYRRRDLDGTLLEGQMDSVIQRGVRMFENPVSMDICRNYVKLCKDEILHKVKMQYHADLFFAEYYQKHEFAVEVLNIRAEQKVSRDLMQDLQDIRDGIRICYDADMQAADKESKKKRREAAKQKRIDKMEKKIMTIGYSNMDQYEQNKACKLLGFDRIEKLEVIREEKIKEEQNKPVQLNLFNIV